MRSLLQPEEAVGLVNDGATVLFGGSGAGHAVPQLFIDTLARVYSETGHPRQLTTVRVVGIGDFADRGFSQLALPGLMRRTIGSNLGNEPALAAMVAAGEIEAYSFPQGVLSQLCREIAAGRPGLLTSVGLDTFVDPRRGGGKQGPATQDLVEVVELAGQEWLFFPSFPVDVAVIRGWEIDQEGNLSMSGEAINGEVLAMAMAAHNSGGIVIAQARHLVANGSLPPRAVAVPGALVDYAYLDPHQTQTYQTDYSPFYSGQKRAAASDHETVPFDHRKVIARRSLLEFRPGDICNLGFGISQLIGAIASEEGVADRLTLTVEQGIFGGVPASGNDGGAGVNPQAIVDQTAMFDFYDGGGLDIASLSFAEVDRAGNVNVHAFGHRLRGAGGFPNISARTPRLCFVGTLTAGDIPRFVPQVKEVTFSAARARRQHQQVHYITDLAVFALDEEGITLIEVAPDRDPEADIFSRMGFRPRISPHLTTMDPRLFSPEPMGLASSFGVLARKGDALASPLRAKNGESR
ncbi:MAG TPA: CoA-transferase [Acidimicrobiia bacterium]|nr:CoA-transferase [Acidimicrobiia bacterium]